MSAKLKVISSCWGWMKIKRLKPVHLIKTSPFHKTIELVCHVKRYFTTKWRQKACKSLHLSYNIQSTSEITWYESEWRCKHFHCASLSMCICKNILIIDVSSNIADSGKVHQWYHIVNWWFIIYIVHCF